MSKPGRKARRVLEDHKRVGKRFIPPLVARLGELRETSWVKRMVPEVLWIALLQGDLGWRLGAQAAVEVGLVAQSLRPRTDGWFGLTSPYATFTGRDQAILCDRLGESKLFAETRRILAPFVSAYPESPLAFVCEGMKRVDQPKFISRLRRLVEQILDKGDIAALRAILAVLEIASRAGLFRVFDGLALANIGALDDYPKTEASQLVAASLRSIAPMLEQDSIRGTNAVWPDYFWNRSLAVDRCEINARS